MPVIEKVPVSVIIPCFNSEQTILRALNSIKEQTYPVQEIICIDDCSTDNTVKTIENFIHHNSHLTVKLFKNESNAGPSFSRNLGWDAAQGDYVAFLDADDSWHPEKLRIHYTWMIKNPDIALSGHLYRLINALDTSSDFQLNSNFKTSIISPDKILFSNPFVTPSVILKRTLEYRFNTKQRYCEDYFLWLQICLDGHKVSMLSIELTYIFKSFGSSGLTRNLLRMKWGDINNYWQLYKSKRISIIHAFFLTVYSLIKLIPMVLLGSAYYEKLKKRIIMKRLEKSPM